MSISGGNDSRHLQAIWRAGDPRRATAIVFISKGLAPSADRPKRYTDATESSREVEQLKPM